MKPKDIIVILISLAIIAGSAFYITRMLKPPAPKAPVSKEAETIIQVPAQLNEKLLKELDKKQDFGEPLLDNLGKQNLFQ